MNQMKKLSVKSMILMGMFAAVLAVLSIIEIPMPSGVPITLQTFAVALCGFVLGHQLGAGSAAIYLAIGAVGVPVFSGGSGGFGALFGVTGGFIFGFISMAFLCGLAVKQKNMVLKVVLCLAGLASCHILGILQFSFITKTSLLQSALLVSVPYLVKDILSMVGAYVGAIAVRKSLGAAAVYEAERI